MGHQPRKRFGQNFLQSQAIINQIIEAIHPQSTDNMIEIGPGMGALTALLLKQVDHLKAIEIDRDLQTHLKNTLVAKEKLTLFDQDALTVDFSQFGDNLRIVGNLPYNISTPLLLHLLTYVSHIDDMHFMLQKELVDRLSAVPGNKDYGRLSIVVQYYCEVDALFDVPPIAFYPPPKVDSAIVRLIPYEKSPYDTIEFVVLEKLVAKAFSMRRKTLANNLKGVLTAVQLAALEIDPGMRPEQISVTDYVRIARSIQSGGQGVS